MGNTCLLISARAPTIAALSAAMLAGAASAQTGACCDRSDGTCWDFIAEAECQGEPLAWFQGQQCFDVFCETRTIYVDQNGSGPFHVGLNWCFAFLTLHDALAFAVPCDLILVADGTYTPSTKGLDNPREATFRLVNGVTIRGGYAGCGAEDPDRRDIKAYRTVLTGDLAGDDVPWFGNTEENAYHVVTAIDVAQTATLEGLTIEGGLADGFLTLDQLGAGLQCLSSHLTVNSCEISRNQAAVGAGVSMIDCSVALTTSQIVGNRGANPNFAPGAGIAAASDTQVTLRNCTIAANSSGSVTATGAGASIRLGSTVEITNCVFWHNLGAGTVESAQIFTDEDSTTVVNYSCVEGLSGMLGGVGNIGLDPMFVDLVGPDGLLGTGDDNPRLLASSPAIDAGDPGFSPKPGESDLDGHARVLCGRVDMGAFEFGIGDSNCDRRSDLLDLAAFQRCFTGAEDGAGQGVCTFFDLDLDNDVDLEDFGALRSYVTGP